MSDARKRHLAKAADIFRKLCVTRLAERAATKLNRSRFHERRMRARWTLELSCVAIAYGRLAEATASRELSVRELVAVLQQESRAKKIIIAESRRQ
jgi:hypothetical protein